MLNPFWKTELYTNKAIKAILLTNEEYKDHLTNQYRLLGYIHLDYVHYTEPTPLAEKVVKGLKYGTLQRNHGLHHSNQNGWWIVVLILNFRGQKNSLRGLFTMCYYELNLTPYGKLQL